MCAHLSVVTSIIQNVVLALSGAATAIIAFLGLSTWRKELKGKSEYAKAKEILKAVYKVRRAFIHVRNPAIFSYEYPEEMRDHYGNLKREFNYEGTAHVYETRWKFLAEAFKELEEQNLDAQVEWGPEFQDVITPLRSCKVDLQVAISSMLEIKKDPTAALSMSQKENAEERSILYYHGESFKFDKFTSEINSAILLFEEKLRPHIKR